MEGARGARGSLMPGRNVWPTTALSVEGKVISRTPRDFIYETGYACEIAGHVQLRPHANLLKRASILRRARGNCRARGNPGRRRHDGATGGSGNSTKTKVATFRGERILIPGPSNGTANIATGRTTHPSSVEGRAS